MKQVKMAALNAMKGRIKTQQATPRALNVQLAGAMQVVGLLDVMRYHPDLILTMEFKIFVNVVTLVPELIHHKYRVQQGNTPTLLDQYHVFHVLPVNLQINMVVLNVLDARKDIFNLNRNNLPVKKFNLVQSQQREDQHQLSYRKDRKLMHLIPLDLLRVQQERKVTFHRTKRVQIVQLENQVQLEQ